MTQARDLADGKFDTSTLVVDAANNRVGVGTASPSHPLHVAQSRASDVVGLIENTNTTSGFGLKIKAGGTDADRYSLRVDSQAGTELFRVRTAGGVTFNGDTAAANALDDYEEGTWTPVLDFRDSSTGSLNYNKQTGRYIKVGGLVFVSAFVGWNQNNFTASAGSLQLEGLPFAHVSQNLYRGGLNITYSETAWTGATIYQGAFRAESGETNFIFNFSDGTDGNMNSTITSRTQVQSSGSFMVTGTYSTV